MNSHSQPVECLTSDLFFLRLFENQRAAAVATSLTVAEIQFYCCDNDVEKNSSTVQPSTIKNLTFRYLANPNQSTSSSVARVDPILKNRRQVDVSVIRLLKEARRDRRPDCRGQLESTTVFTEYMAVICLALDGTPMRKFTDVYTAAACLEGTAVANLKLALYAADNKCGGFRWEFYEGENEYVSKSEKDDVPLKVLIAMRQAVNTFWLAEGADSRYFHEETKDAQMLKSKYTFYHCRIECHNAETGILLHQFENSEIAAKELGLEVQYINEALWSPQRLYNGMKWSYFDRVTSSTRADSSFLPTSSASIPYPTESVSSSSSSSEKGNEYKCVNQNCERSFNSSQGLCNHRRTCDSNVKSSRTKANKKPTINVQKSIDRKLPSSSKVPINSNSINQNRNYRIPNHSTREHRMSDESEEHEGEESSRDHAVMKLDGWLFDSKVPIDHPYKNQCKLIGQPTIRNFPNHGTVSGIVEAYYPDQDVWRNVHDDGDAEDLEESSIREGVRKALKVKSSDKKNSFHNNKSNSKIEHQLIPPSNTLLSDDDGDDECYSIDESMNCDTVQNIVECGSDIESFKRKRDIANGDDEEETIPGHINMTGITIKPQSIIKVREFPILPPISALSTIPPPSLHCMIPEIPFLLSSIPESHSSLNFSPDSFESIAASSDGDDRCPIIDDKGSLNQNKMNDIITSSSGSSSSTNTNNLINTYAESVTVPGISETVVKTMTVCSNDLKTDDLPSKESDSSIDQQTGLPLSILISMAIASLEMNTEGYDASQIAAQIVHLISDDGFILTSEEELDNATAKYYKIVTRIFDDIVVSSQDEMDLPKCKGPNVSQGQSDFIEASKGSLHNNSGEKRYLLSVSGLEKVSLLARISTKIKFNLKEK